MVTGTFFWDPHTKKLYYTMFKKLPVNTLIIEQLYKGFHWVTNPHHKKKEDEVSRFL